MKKYNIPYGNTDIFSQLILDYLNQDKKLNNFYNRYPNIDNFKNQIKEKSNHNIDRSLLINVLKEQNKSLKLSKKSAFICLASIDRFFDKARTLPSRLIS